MTITSPDREGPRPSPPLSRAALKAGSPGSPTSNTALPMEPAMADEEVNFERVTKIYREESSKKTLSRLEPDFYRKAATYVRALEAKAAEEVVKGPNSAKAMLLQDELRKVLKKREQIVQYRQRKIALLAASKANGGEGGGAGLAPPGAGVVRAPLRVPAPVFQRLAAPPRKIAPPAPKDLVIVHVLEDIPAFAGIDAKYTLKKEDVVTLPRALAKVLMDRGKVRLVQTA